MWAVINASSGVNYRWLTYNLTWIKERFLTPNISLKVTGLGTALKILFSGEFDKPHLPGLPKAKEDLKLTRNEIVALFNSFAKLSTSIVELERFRELLRSDG